MSLDYDAPFDESELLIEQDESEIKKQKIHKETRQIISQVDFNTHRGRQLLAKSYRKINSMIDTLEKHQFNQDTQFIDDIVKSAFFYKPYDINNFNFKFQSSFCRDAVCGNRRLKMPIVKIGEQIVNQKTNVCHFNVDTNQFTLKIQSQPNTNIIWTNRQRSHPLLVPNNIQSSQKRFCTNQFVNTMKAPCQLNIIAVSQTKIESKVVTINVTTNQTVGEYNTQHIGYAIRPAQTPFDQSSNNINPHLSMHSQNDLP